MTETLDLSKITYAVEAWPDMYKEYEPFVIPHWEELGLDRMDVPVSIDWARYQELHDAGILHIVTTRDNGTLIGYHMSLVSTALHYSTTPHAMVDLYYLKPEYRKSKVGLKMFQFAERALKNRGVVKIITATKLHLNHTPLFEALGYKASEITFTKVIT